MIIIIITIYGFKTMLCTPQATRCCMAGWITELERIRKRSRPTLKCYTGVCLEKLKKTGKNSFTIASLWYDTWTWDLRNMQEECLGLGCEFRHNHRHKKSAAVGLNTDIRTRDPSNTRQTCKLNDRLFPSTFLSASLYIVYSSTVYHSALHETQCLKNNEVL